MAALRIYLPLCHQYKEESGERKSKKEKSMLKKKKNMWMPTKGSERGTENRERNHTDCCGSDDGLCCRDYHCTASSNENWRASEA